MISQRLADVFEKAAPSEVQLIPVSIADDPDSWYILNPLHIVDCIDYERSVINSFYPHDFANPDKAGKPRGVLRLVIDPERTDRRDIFRVKNWTVATIVSDRLRTALEETWAVGLRFDPVTP